MDKLQYLLTKLAEEGSEVAQIALKTQQFGPHEVMPGQPLSNFQRCHHEIDERRVGRGTCTRRDGMLTGAVGQEPTGKVGRNLIAAAKPGTQMARLRAVLATVKEQA